MDPLIFFRENLSEVEKLLTYTFRNKEFLELAFIHKSYYYESGLEISGHNERLEFLGDAVLELLTSEFLYLNYKDKNEGELSQYRSRLVDGSSLASYTEKIGITEYLVLGKGERKQERKNSLLANLFEAILGAIYLDGGLNSAKQFLFTHISSDIESIMQAVPRSLKTVLQEWAQKEKQVLPNYVVLEESGPDHKRYYRVEVRVSDESIGLGEGFSKKEAEKNAAEDALKRIGILG
jgi:ribonuclease-3